MRLRRTLLAALLSVVASSALAVRATPGPAERIAEGVLLYRLEDPALLDPPGHVAVQALRLDPSKVRLEVALAADRSPAREPVAAIAARRGALAAINGGFFDLDEGAPQAILKSRGQLVGESSRPRGAFGILEQPGRSVLLFDRVTVDRAGGTPAYRTRFGTAPDAWAHAASALSGAGLLLMDGREIDDWTEESLSKGFETTRHPRTMIGVDADGAIWLVTVDGRQPPLSVGMTFAELTRLARRLGLRSALNLDGGGSTTMVLGGNWIVNHPSDLTGPRAVSDAILVFPRRP